MCTYESSALPIKIEEVYFLLTYVAAIIE